ncbi:MAG TPA: T9SS type A sorting domain-containing protein, partial [Flavobacteriales bacterium]|nr:T9SS type A sorting domain-containing protein [Flavobacteriales bacterium]
LAEGSMVEVYAEGKIVGEMEVNTEGYLMTSVIYGDDPQTSRIEGILSGVEISFVYLGAKADQKVIFAGDMSRNSLDLNFGIIGLQIYPNPVSDITTCSFSLAEGSSVRVIMTDAIGREVLEIFEGELPEGNHEYKISTINLESGTFAISLFVDGKEVSSKKVVKTSR